MYDSAAADASVVNDRVKTFTAFYVYGRQGNRVEVGVSDSKADGWLEADKTTVWPQAITMVFTDRLGRRPTLFFRNHDDLVNTCVDERLPDKIKQFSEFISKNENVPADYPVIAAEPPDAAVSKNNFYLLPVLSVDTQFEKDKLRLLEVACLDPGLGDGRQDAGSGGQGGAARPEDSVLRSGFVFVIDTTISMKPYIDQTTKLVRAIYDELEKNPHGDKFAFAVVAFRSNMEKSPKLGYTTQVVCDFKTVKQRNELEAALAQVEEANVSTHAFTEDSFAGVKDAVDSLNWGQFGSRVMLLITDAGPLRENDPTSRTGFSPGVLAEYLKSRSIYLTTVHLKTPAGKADHASAAKAYIELSTRDDTKASYIPIEASTPAKGAEEFDSVTRSLAQGYSKLLTATAEGRILPPPDIDKTASPEKKKLSPEEEAARIAEATGYAMQLQFFGASRGVRAPNVVNAWIAEADLERLAADPQAQPVLAAVPAVLMTKTQLSQLRQQINLIYDHARGGIIRGDEKNFFQSLVSEVAGTARGSYRPGQNLAATGILGEFLEGLPYVSNVMAMTQEDWNDMSTGRRKQFLDHLSARIALYDEYDKDNTNWEGFGSPNRNEWVYRVPLTMLP
ncbi:MAG: VWA domain-containing protein [Candidatus Adiutrix sp.]|nr:VWA domain-containing protein [Candidatus Adiutrix sp.]